MNRRKSIENSKKNLSRIFVLPMVGINYKQLPSNFINSYILNDYKCALVFNKLEDYDEIYYHFMRRIMDTNTNFLEYMDLEDETVFILTIQNKYKADFDLFVKGAYSEFSEPYKKVISGFFGKQSIPKGHLVTEYNVIYPEDFKRKQIAEHLSYKNSKVDENLIKEVLDKPDLTNELFIHIDVLVIQNLTLDNLDTNPINNI